MTLESKVKYGARHGVSHTAVGKWQKAGWLVMQGKLVDVEASDAKLAKYRDSTDSRATRAAKKVSAELKPETKVSTEVATPAPVLTLVPGRDVAPEVLPGETARQAEARLTRGISLDNETSIEEARRVKEIYLALQNQLEYEKKSGSLVDLDTASAILFEEFRAQRDAWLNWPTRVGPILAADLGVEADRVTEALTAHVHKQIAQLGEPEANFAEREG